MGGLLLFLIAAGFPGDEVVAGQARSGSKSALPVGNLFCLLPPVSRTGSREPPLQQRAVDAHWPALEILIQSV
jgi:hypothetical protein